MAYEELISLLGIDDKKGILYTFEQPDLLMVAEQNKEPHFQSNRKSDDGGGNDE